MLQSPLYTNVSTLKLVLNNTAVVIGSIEITNHTTLHDLRIQIKAQLGEKVVPAEFKFVYVCAVRRALRAKGFSPHEASSGSRVRRVLRAGGLPPTTPERNSPLPPQKDTPW
jgi:hypothetical protein